MTEFRTDPGRAAINEYIKTKVYGDGTQKVLKVALFICTGMIAALGVAMSIITKQPYFLLITLVGVIAGVSYPVATHLFLKDAADKASEAFKKETDITLAVSENDILVIKSGTPTGIIEWDKVNEITERETGFFIKAGGDTLLIFSKEAVSSGTYDEAAQVFRTKAKSLKKTEE